MSKNGNEKRFQRSNINWYPGHMAKTRKKIQESLKLVDAVAEIVDARIPISSHNPDLNKIILNKPKIVVLSKCDMADKNLTTKWVEYYKRMNIAAITVDCKSGHGFDLFISKVKGLLKDKIDKFKSRGIINKSVRIMVVGIPNVGKSSFINRMARGKKAKVENRPGVTIGNQWIFIGSNVELLDTPGILWPKLEDHLIAEKLAFCGAIKDQVVDIEDLAVRLLNYLKDKYPKSLENRYKLEADFLKNKDVSGYEILQEIGRKRGMLVSGGKVDMNKASKVVMDEFRSAKLGNFTLDLPEF